MINIFLCDLFKFCLHSGHDLEIGLNTTFKKKENLLKYLSSLKWYSHLVWSFLVVMLISGKNTMTIIMNFIVCDSGLDT